MFVVERSWSLACLALAAILVVLPWLGRAPALGAGGAVDPALIEDLVAANHILSDQNVLDGFGHVSVRHPTNPEHFLMSRSLAPALVTTEDIMEYDLDGNPVDARGRTSFLERFIHSEIYRARADVKAVVHCHSPSVIPFSTVQTSMQPMYHMAAFLSGGVPVFEIRKVAGMTNMLIDNPSLGQALAQTLRDKSVALMRGHGAVIVGPSLSLAVFRAVYTEVNARLQTQAILIGGPITYLAPEEAELVNKQLDSVHLRAWELWKRAAAARTP